MDLRKLKTLIDLVSDSNVSELEITDTEGKVRIVKAAVAAPAYQQPVAAPAAVIPASVIAAPAPAPEPASVEAVTEQFVKSPMVGTFYRSASPGTKPFAEVGDAIRSGETICIIEAMKILNEIEADKSGTIVKVLCENGQAVEYGQPLFLIE